MKEYPNFTLEGSLLAIKLGLSKDDNDPQKHQVLKLSLLKELKKMKKNQLKVCESYSAIISIIEMMDVS